MISKILILLGLCTLSLQYSPGDLYLPSGEILDPTTQLFYKEQYTYMGEVIWTYHVKVEEGG